MIAPARNKRLSDITLWKRNSIYAACRRGASTSPAERKAPDWGSGFCKTLHDTLPGIGDRPRHWRQKTPRDPTKGHRTRGRPAPVAKEMHPESKIILPRPAAWSCIQLEANACGIYGDWPGYGRGPREPRPRALVADLERLLLQRCALGYRPNDPTVEEDLATCRMQKHCCSR